MSLTLLTNAIKYSTIRNVRISVHLLEKLIHSFIIAILLIPVQFDHIGLTSSAYHQTIVGYDISYPQCDKNYPENPAFAVIGVNGGRPFTNNQCFHDQYKWAIDHFAKPAVYMNLSYISPRSAEYTQLGPQLCPPDDEFCLSYNYGFQAAQFAYSQTDGFKVRPSMWWLDIETMNTWSNDTRLNQQVIQGAIDYFNLKKEKIGVYSTPYQWRVIAGDYKPMLPVWAAGAKNKFTTQIHCSDKYSFTGGEVHMVQFIENEFDNNHLCFGKKTG